ncbi:hypothetical protein [Larkinella arboricola]
MARGLSTLVYLFMLDEQLDNYTFDSTQPNVITAINLKASEKMYVVEGAGFSNQATVTGTPNDYGFSIAHGFRLVIFDDSPAVKAWVTAICSRTDIAIAAKKKGKGGTYEGYGFNSGFRVNNLSSDTNDESLRGAIVLEFVANDEDDMPYTIQKLENSVDVTESYLASLAAPDA